MIDFGKILKRAWHILWNYRILWIFGILLAMTTGSGSGPNGSSGSSNYNNNGGNGNPGINWNSSPFLHRPVYLVPAEYRAAPAPSRPVHCHVRMDWRWPVALHSHSGILAGPGPLSDRDSRHPHGG